MRDPIDTIQIDDLRRVVTTLTQGNYQWGVHEADSLDEATAWVRDCFAHNPGTTLHMVIVGNPDVEGGAQIVALTGNGPNAEHNAQGLTALLMFAPDVLEELEAWREWLHRHKRALYDAAGNRQAISEIASALHYPMLQDKPE